VDKTVGVELREGAAASVVGGARADPAARRALRRRRRRSRPRGRFAAQTPPRPRRRRRGARARDVELGVAARDAHAELGAQDAQLPCRVGWDARAQRLCCLTHWRHRSATRASPRADGLDARAHLEQQAEQLAQRRRLWSAIVGAARTASPAARSASASASRPNAAVRARASRWRALGGEDLRVGAGEAVERVRAERLRAGLRVGAACGASRVPSRARVHSMTST
jgi:hypothetical protein